MISLMLKAISMFKPGFASSVSIKIIADENVNIADVQIMVVGNKKDL